MDLHTWMATDLRSVHAKLADSVLNVVPRQRWLEQADGGGSSITHIALHVARHQDLAVTTAIRNRPPLFTEHRDSLGLAEAPPFAGLGEREEPAISAAISPDALITYLDEVFATTEQWLDGVGTMALDTVPDTSRRLSEQADISVDDVGWLHRMWADKAVWWFVQWPVLGHGNAHVGEAISVRNRMGLSPF